MGEASEKYQESKMSEERLFQIKKQLLLEKFSKKFHKELYYNPLYKTTYETLLRGADQYRIIENLLDHIGELQKIINEQAK